LNLRTPKTSNLPVKLAWSRSADDTTKIQTMKTRQMKPWKPAVDEASKRSVSGFAAVNPDEEVRDGFVNVQRLGSP
jgi:hypothetical protein